MKNVGQVPQESVKDRESEKKISDAFICEKFENNVKVWLRWGQWVHKACDDLEKGSIILFLCKIYLLEMY